MTQKIYVGNLPFTATEEDVRQLFQQHGAVQSVNLITDRNTGRPRGFGFVEMSSGMDEAIQALGDASMGGRRLTVNVARSRGARPSAPRQSAPRQSAPRSNNDDSILSAANLRLLHAKLFSSEMPSLSVAD